MAHEKHPSDFESLLLLEGAGPRTIQSLTLVSEIIYGTPSRFTDPARFSFAHGGKDGHPFPVPLKVYDETIQVLKTSIEKAKLGMTVVALGLDVAQVARGEDVPVVVVAIGLGEQYRQPAPATGGA